MYQAMGLLLHWFAMPLLNHVTRPLAGAWWLGPLLVGLVWGVMPIMRLRTRALVRGVYGHSARFWWAPGWGHVGLAGAGLCLVTAPLLHPGLAARWAPSAWLGFQTSLTLLGMGAMVASGVALVVLAVAGYVKAWVRDFRLRYRAWRWRMGAARGIRRPGRDI